MCKIMEEMRKEERAEGRAEGRTDAALRMLAAGRFSLNEISELCGLSLEDVKKLQKKTLS